MQANQQISVDSVTVILRGYLSREYRESQRTVILPLANAATPRQIIAHLSIPVGAVGLLLMSRVKVDRQQVSMDTPLQGGDTLEVLPLLGGG
jgi:molybdopterin converting factor small subunit